METRDLISIQDFCVYNKVEYTFIDHLKDAGLIEVTLVDQTAFIPTVQIQRVERLVRLHTQLDINPQGVVAIDSLLEKLDLMQQEISLLRSKLRLYEEV
ncbi:hypothetical protein DYU05_15510 [Mucilaginibacter terrenus]|uniref:MerR family transcriptional regulator n=1 Tax=Mucilaginibacter terrenus TaxID=2482727 RepID=A0A3E2NM13_9SPHI|nr:chaperone modulator CbpM [Mucilaginibacter terrenus]RFZ82036.1 hypothetical protein DYU05_15510 [Mucilaginibacter terrenus]